MASKLRMTSQGYGKIERNEVEITLQKLQKIAEILGTTIQDIFGFEDKFVFNNRECQHNNIGLNNNINLQEYQKIYEERISDLQKEITRLYGLLEKSLLK
jgi:transcriptional regulator with XRE-family HTH domain